MSAETAKASERAARQAWQVLGPQGHQIPHTDVARFGTGGASGSRRRRDAARPMRKAEAAEIQDAARYGRWTLAEYERLGIEPVRSASGMLLASGLAGRRFRTVAGGGGQAGGRRRGSRQQGGGGGPRCTGGPW